MTTFSKYLIAFATLALLVGAAMLVFGPANAAQVGGYIITSAFSLVLGAASNRSNPAPARQPDAAPAIRKPDTSPPAARSTVEHRQVNPVRLALWQASEDRSTRVVRAAPQRRWALLLAGAMLLALAARALTGCSTGQAAAAKAAGAVAKFGACAAERAWSQCAPVAKTCLAAQLKQCAGLEPKAPWVEPPRKCTPTSQPAK